jgi:hypothetical protein
VRPHHARTYAETQAARVKLVAWVDAHGLVCPGLEAWEHEPHPVAHISELSEHHLIPWAQGGRHGPTMVLCLAFNMEIGDRIAPQK